MKQADVFSRSFKCVRCGICCLLGHCVYGEEGDEIFCRFLSFDQNKVATCSLITGAEGPFKDSFKDISLGKGCLLQKIPDKYELCKGFYKEVIEAKAGVR